MSPFCINADEYDYEYSYDHEGDERNALVCRDQSRQVISCNFDNEPGEPDDDTDKRDTYDYYPDEYNITIISAFLQTDVDGKCGDQITNIPHCSKNISLEVKSMCDGKDECNLSNMESFGDPCEDSFKSILKYKYLCEGKLS